MNDAALRCRAERAGIEPGYRDAWGRYHAATDATLRALLRAMDHASDGPASRGANTATAPTPARAPARAWCPEALRGDGRRWGIAVQTYALRTRHTWGIGDFSALAELVRGAAAIGAATVGISPLHALFPSRPERASPYSPSDRRFINPLYLDIEAMPDFAACAAAREAAAHPAFEARVQHARQADTIQYATVTDLKYKLFPTLYDRFCNQCLEDAMDPRARAFRAFQHAEGHALRQFATFEAIADARPGTHWRDWPGGLSDPESPDVAAFAATHAHAIQFHEYLQWQAAAQLDHVRATAERSGMRIGLYADFAVGTDPCGAEAWATQASLAHGASIGAPPDALNLQGQDWGLPPPLPWAMTDGARAPVADLWQANMRSAGALRIDHIMGLARLYWIPSGAAPTDGAYVRYPWDTLLQQLAECSTRCRCMVVGEDLGTVPDGLRESMHASDVLSHRLLFFEQHGDLFPAARDYPADALVAVGTHDLPSLPIWWHGEDITLRDRAGLWPGSARRDAEIDDRRAARGALIMTLRREGLHDDAEVPDAAPIEAIHAYLARTRSKLLMARLVDLLGMHTQANVPGTVDAHPNWRQRLPCSVAEALAHPRVKRIAAIMTDAGRDDR